MLYHRLSHNKESSVCNSLEGALNAEFKNSSVINFFKERLPHLSVQLKESQYAARMAGLPLRGDQKRWLYPTIKSSKPINIISKIELKSLCSAY